MQFLDRANGTLSGGPAQAELRAVADGLFFIGFVLIGGFGNKGSEAPLKEIRESLAWTRCEKEALEMGKVRGACKEGDGEEMMSCSRVSSSFVSSCGFLRGSFLTLVYSLFYLCSAKRFGTAQLVSRLSLRSSPRVARPFADARFLRCSLLPT